MLSLVTGETLTDENLSKGCTTRMLNNSRSDSRVRVGGIFLYVIDTWGDEKVERDLVQSQNAHIRTAVNCLIMAKLALAAAMA